MFGFLRLELRCVRQLRTVVTVLVLRLLTVVVVMECGGHRGDEPE
ncbi:MAG: hypothetical protein AAGM22_30670 [Acidobacteriota bacterium]